MPNRSLAATLLVIASAPLSACSPTIKQPQLLHPGPAPVQRYAATQFDPYPLPDMGPEIVGGRPPDYLVPVPEVKRANQFRESHPAPSLPMFAPQGQPVLPAYPGSLPMLPAAAAPTPPVVRY